MVYFGWPITNLNEFKAFVKLHLIVYICNYFAIYDFTRKNLENVTLEKCKTFKMPFTKVFLNNKHTYFFQVNKKNYGNSDRTCCTKY